MYMYKILSSSLDPLWAFLWDSWRIPQLIAWLELLSKIFQAEMLQDSRCRAFTDEGFFVSHLTRVLTQQKKRKEKKKNSPGDSLALAGILGNTWENSKSSKRFWRVIYGTRSDFSENLKTFLGKIQHSWQQDTRFCFLLVSFSNSGEEREHKRVQSKRRWCGWKRAPLKDKRKMAAVYY